MWRSESCTCSRQHPDWKSQDMCVWLPCEGKSWIPPELGTWGSKEGDGPVRWKTYSLPVRWNSRWMVMFCVKTREKEFEILHFMKNVPERGDLSLGSAPAHWKLNASVNRVPVVATQCRCMRLPVGVCVCILNPVQKAKLRREPGRNLPVVPAYTEEWGIWGGCKELNLNWIGKMKLWILINWNR